jgi:hypothetical protein
MVSCLLKLIIALLSLVYILEKRIGEIYVCITISSVYSAYHNRAVRNNYGFIFNLLQISNTQKEGHTDRQKFTHVSKELSSSGYKSKTRNHQEASDRVKLFNQLNVTFQGMFSETVGGGSYLLDLRFSLG